MKKYFFSLLAFTFPLSGYMAGNISIEDIGIGRLPSGSILTSEPTLLGALSLIQGILLKAVLPLIVVGTSLYIAYHLFTAEGDEARMKQAWRSLAYSSIALIVIALSYAMISIFANISL